MKTNEVEQFLLRSWPHKKNESKASQLVWTTKNTKIVPHGLRCVGWLLRWLHGSLLSVSLGVLRFFISLARA
jgi:hypothetical protein